MLFRLFVQLYDSESASMWYPHASSAYPDEEKASKM